ncbi:MAG: hypothetical protein QY330_01125 [Candidatus Dojkabacteria bacterium]|uniref:Response regulatory domain-containing protein n=1 Tax=candidate division WS6 bacterium OLB21 TaxID=1617427 RepID=A0A136KLF4_9BACT|nr:MAG: hypothetical protein UZ20_WS6002000042 [candidate division WS6 bacterium OLB21]WKZ28192.1 MAG: hypothetical protein QY330_01125 [Candidatus Dojkabacteria bacterium]
MEKNPVIIQFDGEENYHTVVDLICYNMQLEIRRHISNVNQARTLFADIESGKLKPDIAIISSFLEKKHTDGSAVAKKLREVSPDTKIIAYTVIEDEDWHDELAVKSGRNPEKNLIEVLTRLTGKDFNFSNAPTQE